MLCYRHREDLLPIQVRTSAVHSVDWFVTSASVLHLWSYRLLDH